MGGDYLHLQNLHMHLQIGASILENMDDPPITQALEMPRVKSSSGK